MQKLKMKTTKTLTFEEGCNKYLEYCQQRNLRQGTINHYKQSYTQFYKFFDPETPIEEIDEDAYKRYVLHLKSTLNNDVSINSYLRDFITTLHFLMNDGCSMISVCCFCIYLISLNRQIITCLFNILNRFSGDIFYRFSTLFKKCVENTERKV
ncbi:MAG: phage integrase SAM-like domain-containing protein [Clostridia bacterium]|nr:phage integrase SAM-like domain-containing protein [Clostridia bacterium]